MTAKSARKCIACDGRLKEVRIENVTIDRCQSCDGMQSNGIYLGESYTLVLPYFEIGSYNEDEPRYFDFTALGSDGVGRRHGWYLPRTRRIAQIG